MGKKKEKKTKENEISNSSKETTDMVQSSKEHDVEESSQNKSCLDVTEDGADSALLASKKKKKKKKKKEEEMSQIASDSLGSPDTSEFFTPNTSMAEPGVLEPKSTDLTESKKKKKKKLKRSATEAGLGIVDDGEKSTDLKQEHTVKTAEEIPKLEEPTLKPPEEPPTLSKKNEEEEKEMHRIDSDIAFNAPSLSKINLMLGKSEDTKAEETMAVIPEAEKSEPSTPVLSAK